MSATTDVVKHRPKLTTYFYETIKGDWEQSVMWFCCRTCYRRGPSFNGKYPTFKRPLKCKL